LKPISVATQLNGRDTTPIRSVVNQFQEHTKKRNRYIHTYT
jgi:hypothetical protein